MATDLGPCKYLHDYGVACRVMAWHGVPQLGIGCCGLASCGVPQLEIQCSDLACFVGKLWPIIVFCMMI